MKQRYDFHDEVLRIIKEELDGKLENQIRRKDLRSMISFWRVDKNTLNQVLRDLEDKGKIKQTKKYISVEVKDANDIKREG